MQIFRFSVALYVLLTGAVYSQTANYDHGSIYDLDPPAFETSGRGLEQIIAENDMEPIDDLSQSDFLRRMARPVGRFVFTNSSGSIFYCTASLIADDLMLTNDHCVNDIAEGVLWMGYLRPRDDSGVAMYEVELPVLEQNSERDYAILRVRGNPGRTWGTVTLSRRVPEPRQSLFMIHHPGGMVQHITRGRCQAADPSVERDELIHVCDTMGGSSGAPIFDFETREVVGLHYRRYSLQEQNGGQLIATLAGVSSIVADLIDTATPAAPSTPDLPTADVVLPQKPDDDTSRQNIAGLLAACVASAHPDSVSYSELERTAAQALEICQRVRDADADGLGPEYAHATALLFRIQRTRGDEVSAMRYLHTASELGDGYALRNLGYYYTDMGRDYPRGLRLFRSAIAAGEPCASGNLGAIYNHGIGVPAQPKAAADWYMLGLAAGCEDGALVDPARWLTPDVVREMQRQLQADGHYLGAIDGVAGSGTISAMRSYLEANS